MDRLSRNAMLARQAGMTYGKWKALQPIVPIEKKPIPEGWRKCEYCGNAFPGKQGKRFCDVYCREQAYKPRASEIKQEYNKLRRKEMAL